MNIQHEVSSSVQVQYMASAQSYGLVAMARPHFSTERRTHERSQYMKSVVYTKLVTLKPVNKSILCDIQSFHQQLIIFYTQSVSASLRILLT